MWMVHRRNSHLQAECDSTQQRIDSGDGDFITPTLERFGHLKENECASVRSFSGQRDRVHHGHCPNSDERECHPLRRVKSAESIVSDAGQQLDNWSGCFGDFGVEYDFFNYAEHHATEQHVETNSEKCRSNHCQLHTQSIFKSVLHEFIQLKVECLRQMRSQQDNFTLTENTRFCASLSLLQDVSHPIRDSP